jgi:hypothetical protein
MNINPIGEWELQIPSNVETPWGRVDRKGAGGGFLLDPPREGDLLAFVRPTDIVVAIRVAIRR